ncbi:TetR/AcrR family transcriptional regulator [Mycetocola saprophilus]|uniref:TetR/AcrR family transcriptional regulator n=1 Tax=Mycetocola saprophilus TaxID=76636 RepID=UPI00068C8976|nr:TetR/AcrR family transcriptional regulator [Mycetocola saprophilus]
MTTTKRGPYRKGIERRAEILRTAGRVFGEYGYAGASLRQIADEVGVTAALLIAHFGSKEGLLIAILKHLADEGDAAMPNDGVGIEFFTWYSPLMKFHLQRPGFIDLLLTLAAEASSPTHPARDFMVERYRLFVAKCVAQLEIAHAAGDLPGVRPEKFEFEARAFIALLDGVELQWRLEPEMDLFETVTSNLEVMLSRWSEREIILTRDPVIPEVPGVAPTPEP